MAFSQHEWFLKRNCSMSPRQVAIAYGALCLLTFMVASAFALRGMWLVLPFAALETCGLGVALFHYARHALDHEHIALSEGCLLVERVQGGACEQVRLDPYWTRISLPSARQRLIRIESRGVSLEVGGFVSDETRRRVANELRTQLRASSYETRWR